ncbi:aminotransferase class I/II-fold pyridoxal phosphate-dependent enzyme [Acidaminococcus sp.]|uniref:aminotransferase class I/II-fold pyridoxal phosphate-dependent enzyme n=1 Tax=Acidaminococcus sp. TaxID=1872103 RepID=UPI003D7DF60F
MTVKRPLLTAVETYRQAHVYPLHTPGHKGGRGADSALRHLVGDVALESDVSLMEELDDIHHPEGCIREAEALAAKVYGADRCFLGVNGTTGVIHGMLLGALRPGDRILVPRNCHRSVLGGMILAGLQPVYVQPAYEDTWRLSLQLSPEQVEEAFARHPDLKAVFLTTPNYFGLAADTKKIADMAHQHGAVLLVDEAHGPHLGFSDMLPPSAVQCGADAAAQSTHKIVGAMTQCSLLQVRYERLRPEAMEQAMSLVTTTSPNYLLMGALDGARAQLEEKGAAMAEASVRAAAVLRKALHQVPGLPVLENELNGKGGVVALDPGKVTIQVSQLGITGPEAADALRQAGIAVELVDQDHVLFLVTYADDNDAFPTIAERIATVLDGLRKPLRELPPVPPVLSIPEQVLPPREAFFAAKEMVPFEEAAGRVAGETLSFYPPGIPLIMPGERLTEELIAFSRRLQEKKLQVSGPHDPTLGTFEVLV